MDIADTFDNHSIVITEEKVVFVNIFFYHSTSHKLVGRVCSTKILGQKQ